MQRDPRAFWSDVDEAALPPLLASVQSLLDELK